MKNPFDFSNKVKKPELFFGRRELLRKLYQTLNTLGKCSIVGPRRIGKSSLLYQLTLPDWYSSYLDEPDSYIFALIDLQLLATSDANHFLNMLVKRLCAASRGRLQTSLKEHDTQQFVNFLEDARANSLKLVLCCDEFESLNRDKGFKCDENFFFFLRGMLNEYDVTMITSSQTPLSELCNTSGLPTSPLWNIFINFPLNLMAENEARSLIADPFARCNQILMKDDIDFIYDLAGPHPFFVQMACYFAFECMSISGYIEYPKVERQFFDSASEHYAHVWNKLNDEKKNGLRRFVQYGDVPNEVAFKKLKAEAIINDQNQLSSRGWRWFIERQLQRTSVSSADHLTKEDSVASHSLNGEPPLQEKAASPQEKTKGNDKAGPNEPEDQVAASIIESKTVDPRKVFISYSWDDGDHKNWVRAFATRLRSDGIDVTLDQWHLVPGDQLSEFMERAVHESDYVLIVCTHKYKERSNNRQGGVGYEGDIISAEFMATRNSRKFIPILRQKPWLDSAPSWMLGKYYIDLSSAPYAENNYDDLLTTLLGKRQKAPPVGT